LDYLSEVSLVLRVVTPCDLVGETCCLLIHGFPVLFLLRLFLSLKTRKAKDMKDEGKERRGEEGENKSSLSTSFPPKIEIETGKENDRRKHVPPKRRYPPARLHVVTTKRSSLKHYRHENLRIYTLVYF
jgi:hypothetical protein